MTRTAAALIAKTPTGKIPAGKTLAAQIAPFAKGYRPQHLQASVA